MKKRTNVTTGEDGGRMGRKRIIKVDEVTKEEGMSFRRWEKWVIRQGGIRS